MNRGVRGRTLIVLAIGAVLVAAAGGYRLGLMAPPASAPARETPAEVPKEIQRVWETWSVLSTTYVEPERVDPGRLSEGAIRGMLDALGDPYTAYLTPDHYRLETEALGGKFEGIGAEVDLQAGQVIVVAPLEGSPAQGAGLQAEDVILEVDGQRLAGRTLAEAVLMIRGPKGTAVSLLVLHRGAPQPEEVSIVRAEIVLPTVKWRMLDGSIAYLRISSFNETTPAALREVLREAKERGATGLVLDLRNNPGGLLSATVDVASQFMPEGLVLYEVDRAGERKEWRVRQGDVATSLPMVVVVNGASASGSEVLAGALQASGRATLVGTTTFGKGSVNVLRRLSDGSGLYVTTARWYTPDGRLIQGKGLIPDLVVEQPKDAALDVQLERSLALLTALLTSLALEK